MFNSCMRISFSQHTWEGFRAEDESLWSCPQHGRCGVGPCFIILDVLNIIPNLKIGNGVISKCLWGCHINLLLTSKCPYV